MFGKKTTVTEADVLNALRVIQDPDLHKDIVSLGFVKDLQIENSKVSFTIELTTPACPVKAKFESDARQAVMALPGVSEVNVKMTANVATRQQPRAHPNMPNVKHIISVASGKGGVGKSTVAVNLAIALSDTGANVGLLDLDVYGPSIPIMLGVRSQPDSTEAGIVPIFKYGIRMMSIGFLTERGTPIMWRGPMIGKFLSDMLGQVIWGDVDYLVVDMPPGTGDAALSLAQGMPVTGAVIVTTPQDVALEDVLRSAHMFEKLRIPLLGVIENMSYYVCPHCGERENLFDHGGGQKAADELGVPLLGEVPLDIKIRLGGDGGVPIVKGDPSSPQAQAFAAIAGQLAARISTLALSEEAGVIPMTGLQ